MVDGTFGGIRHLIFARRAAGDAGKALRGIVRSVTENGRNGVTCDGGDTVNTTRSKDLAGKGEDALQQGVDSMDNYFTALNSVDVSTKTETKNGLTYLSWAYAWGELKKRRADATYTIYENAQGWNYHTDGKTCWVKTGVTVCGIEHVEYLPVMDYRNKSISAENVTSTDVNKAIQRSLTKAVARHGLGLYVYAGEDLPESAQSEDVAAQPPQNKSSSKVVKVTSAEPDAYDPRFNAARLDKLAQEKNVDYDKIVAAIIAVTGSQMRANQLTEEQYNRVVQLL